VFISKDDRFVLTGSTDGVAILHDLITGNIIQRYIGVSAVTSVAISNNNQ